MLLNKENKTLITIKDLAYNPTMPRKEVTSVTKEQVRKLADELKRIHPTMTDEQAMKAARKRLHNRHNITIDKGSGGDRGLTRSRTHHHS